jgi:ectoine hydroxylase-related dioxygenase (phytanoyl-CoA dioxygenase family)
MGESSNGRFAGPLGPEAQGFYAENGFLVVERAIEQELVQAMRREAAAICRGERGDIPGLIPATPGETDDEVLARHLCVHFPHKVSPLFLELLSHPALVDALRALIGPDVKCMQSMLFIKASGKPGQAWHQDEDYIPTRDRSLTGCWIALDKATTENGCLWVIPGSQRPGVLWPMRWHADERFDCSWESFDFPYSDTDAVPVEVEAGSIVVFNGYLLHRSLPNRAPFGYRRALVNHYMSATSLLPWIWPEQPTGMAQLDFRDIVMVCGQDPYAYKGLEDRSRVHVRPSGEGGCGHDERSVAGATEEEPGTSHG